MVLATQVLMAYLLTYTAFLMIWLSHNTLLGSLLPNGKDF